MTGRGFMVREVDEITMRPPGHEVFNGVTHLAAAAAALVGLVVLVHVAEGAAAAAALGVYGTSLVLLYLASGLYHILPVGEDVKTVLQRVDRTAIYLLIAGTYTPVAVLVLPSAWGWTLLGIVWALAGIGIALNWTIPHVRWVPMVLYLGMGWLALAAVDPLMATVPWDGLLLLLAGGVAYTVGVIVMGAGRPDPWPDVVGAHGVWHLLVMAGSVAHFVFMLRYVA